MSVMAFINITVTVWINPSGEDRLPGWLENTALHQAIISPASKGAVQSALIYTPRSVEAIHRGNCKSSLHSKQTITTTPPPALHGRAMLLD